MASKERFTTQAERDRAWNIYHASTMYTPNAPHYV